MPRSKRTEEQRAAVERIGKRVRAVRESKRPKLSRFALSVKTGISYDHLCTIEQGKHEPKTPTLKKLAAALGVSVKSLRDDPPENGGKNGGGGRRK